MNKSNAGIFAAIAAAILFSHETARAGTWNISGGGSWATAGNWNDSTVPNATGASAAFNAVGSTARAVTVDSGAPGFTVGSILYDAVSGTTQTTSINTGASGSNLKLNNGGSGVTISTTNNGGTGNLTIAAPLSLNDNVIANVNQQNTASAALSLNLTATMSGNGGFTKNGDGGATFGTGTKTYTGATVLNGGRIRISVTAQPSGTASFTINAGGQLDTLSSSTYSFGPSGTLFNLNGSGPTTGQFAPFPGAIRPDTGVSPTFSNKTVLQSDALVHMEGTADLMTFTNVVSGPGKLIVGSIPHDANLGKVILNGNNTYAGGSRVQVGILTASGASAKFGTGDITVINPIPDFAGSYAAIEISSGVTNAITDTATVSLGGGGTASATTGSGSGGYAILGTGVNEFVARLNLGGVAQPWGTYGSTASAAQFKSDTYFAGTGILTVTTPIPEPASIILLGLAALGFVSARRAR